MSDPRIIPADEARSMREAATDGPWEPFHDTWEDYGPDGEVIAEYEQSGVIGGDDGILDTRPRPSLMDAPNQWEESGEHDNRANTRLAAAAPSLAFTVEQQDAKIKRLQAALRAGPEEIGGLNEAVIRQLTDAGILHEGDMQ